MHHFTCCSQAVVLMLQIKKAIEHHSCLPWFRRNKSLFYWKKKKKKMNHVSAELCFAPRRSHRVLGSHGTNQLGSRLSHAKPQTVTANSCCHAGAKKGHFSADDVIICSLPNPFSGPCSEGHSRTVIFYQTPCCYLPLKMICSSNIVTVSNPERCSKEGDSYTANDKMAKT